MEILVRIRPSVLQRPAEYLITSFPNRRWQFVCLYLRIKPRSDDIVVSYGREFVFFYRLLFGVRYFCTALDG